MESFRSRPRRMLAGAKTPEAALGIACAEIERRIAGARVAAFVYDRDRLSPCIVAKGISAEFVAAIGAQSGDRQAGPWMRAFDRHGIVSFADMSTDARWSAFHGILARARLRGGWFVPLTTTSGRKVGLLAILHDLPRRPTGSERAAARRIGELAAIAVQRERLHEENRESAHRLTNLMANVPGVVFQWSIAPGGALSLPFVSDSAEAITGHRADEIARHPLRLLARVPRGERRRLLTALTRSARDLEPACEDFPIACGRHGTRWLRIMSRPRRRGDGTILSDALCLDITNGRTAEETQRRSQAELNERLLELHRTKARLESQSAVLMETAQELTKARDSAEQASRAKSEFLSNMSHELRTPLNAIIGFSEIIRQQTFGPVGSPKYRDYASDIYVSGLHLLELINDILDFAKIEAGKEQLHCDSFGFAEVLDAVIRIVHERAERAGLTIHVDLARDLPPVFADRRKIRQILLNLLSNAIKFTERGGKVAVTAWCSDAGGFVVQVTDTGIGIALEDIPKALGVFGQIDNPFSRRHEGTGLGLPLSKALVEMHGGSLDLQSQPGVGTTVTVRLPAERIVRDGAKDLQRIQHAG